MILDFTTERGLQYELAKLWSVLTLAPILLKGSGRSLLKVQDLRIKLPRLLGRKLNLDVGLLVANPSLFIAPTHI